MCTFVMQNNLQSPTKYLAQSKEIEQNWTRVKTFDI